MASPAKVKRRDWPGLPREVVAEIFSRLSSVDTLTSAQFVCKAWHEVSKDPLAWKKIDICRDDDDDEDDPEFNFHEICYHAVDRSCGQAVEIRLDNFGDDDLLEYIVDRSKRIKLLRISRCHQISGEGLVTAFKKLPLLEEIEITLCSFNPKVLKHLGRKCPLLKSFKLNSLLYMCFKKVSDREAMAIGKYMPGLKTLQLIGNYMTNKGLGAILDGCPRLESLDLRGCINIRLEGEAWERCTERVKNLRLPRDSTREKLFLNLPEIDFTVTGSHTRNTLSYKISGGDDGDDDLYDYVDDTDVDDGEDTSTVKLP